jgi:hypothetical protein
MVLVEIAAAFLLTVPVLGQVDTGRISGAVTDQTGGAIVGAMVTVTEVATGVARNLTTDSAAQYAAPNLTPGIYTVRAGFMGFQATERQNIQVGVGGDIRVDITLQPGQQSQTVTVTESLPVINTTNAQTGGTLENQILTSLPMAGRNYRWQQDLVPGVMIAKGQGTGNIDANGTIDGHGSNTMIDGVSTQSYFLAEPSFGGSSEAGDTTLLPLDAIQEINLVINPKAEYGWIPGVTNNVGLKSGTNNLHGDFYAFGRDTSFDARNAFATARFPTSFEQYGGTLGGPIKKDKIFYFLGFEGFNENLTSVVTETPPTLADTGNVGLSIPDAIVAINKYIAAPTAGNPVVALNNLSLNIAGCNPSNTGIHSTVVATVAAACASGNQFGAPGLWANPSIGVLPDFGYSENGLGKIDYHINDHHTLNGSYARGYYVENAAANSAAKIAQSYWEEILGVKAQMTRVAEVWTPNSSWLNEARYGLDQQSRPTSRAECTTDGQDPFSNPLGIGASTGGFGGPNYVTQYGLLSGSPACGLPTIILASPVSAQLSFSNAKAHSEKEEQGSDVLSYTRGRHQFKFGVDIRAINFVGAKAVDQQSGVINFGGSSDLAFTGANSLEDFLTGVPASESIRGGSVGRNVSENLFGMFAQDDWRIVPRLTLNLGLREEIVTPPTSNATNLGNFNPAVSSSNVTGITAGTNGFNTQYHFEPRVGFAWDVTGKGTTTVRGGGGVLYGLTTIMNFIAGAGSIDLSAVPTGFNLVNAAGATVATAPGNGKSVIETLVPQVGTGTTNKGVVLSSPIIWPTNSQNSATTALFPSTLPTSCGNGLPETGNPAVLNPNPCAMYGVSPNFHYYEYIFWNANFEHAFTSNFSVDVGYVGSRSTNILQNINLNQAAPTDNTSLANPSSEQAAAPYQGVFPWFSTINYATASGNVNYRSLQVALTERPAHGLTFNVAYSLSAGYQSQGLLNIHIPVSSGSNGPYGGNYYPLHNLKVTASYNVPTIRAPAQLLTGWQVSGSLVVESSLPFSVLDTKDDLAGAGPTVGSGSGTFTAQPSSPWTLYGPADPFNKLFGRAGTIPCYGVAAGTGVSQSAFSKVANCTSVLAGSSSTPWTNMPAACITAAQNEASFAPGLTQGQAGTGLAQLAAVGCYMVNGSAIVPPAQGTYGTMLPNALRGPGEGLVNIAVTKDIKFSERWKAQFRWETFNLFNRTQYAGPGVNLGSPNLLGAATGTPDIIQGGGYSYSGGPRSMQLGLKILF